MRILIDESETEEKDKTTKKEETEPLKVETETVENPPAKAKNSAGSIIALFAVLIVIVVAAAVMLNLSNTKKDESK